MAEQPEPSSPQRPNGIATPRPDPTSLTTQQLERAISATEDLFDARLDVLRERLDAIDKATTLLASGLEKTPAEIQRVTDSLRDLAWERFDSVQTQFKERDIRQERESRDNKCVTADTPILCTDLVWRPAGDLLVGDELIGFDAVAPAGGGGRSGSASRGRMFRRAVVTANSVERDALLRVNTPRGSVRCTYDHPWLSRGPHPVDHRWVWHWVRTEDLRPGDQVLQLFDVWEVDRSYEGGWLSGMFDGEGCLSFTSGAGTAARLGIVQRTSPTADRIAEVMKGMGFTFRSTERYPATEAPPTAPGRRRENRQPMMTFDISTRAEVMRVLGSIRPVRLLVNSDRVWEGRTITGKHRMTTVTSVEGAGSGLIASLSTSTETYIAAGFAMHNTAVDAAFAAQKEAAAKQDESNEKSILKSERATNDAIAQMGELMRTGFAGVGDKIEDLKDRVGKTETSVVALTSTDLGAKAQKTEQRGAGSYALAIAGAVVGFIGITLAIVSFIVANSGK